MPEVRLLKLNETGFAKRRALLEAQTKKNRPSAVSVEAATAKGKETKGPGKKGEGSRKRGRDTGLETVSQLCILLGVVYRASLTSSGDRVPEAA